MSRELVAKAELDKAEALLLKNSEIVREISKLLNDLSNNEKFAEMLELSPQFVSDVERGIEGISLVTSIKICNIMKCSPLILFAKIEASKDDLADGDPYYFYKASGAISSDIDLYFEGKGYLEITSNKKEGIETKGNLTFSGGTGDYVIEALDDCLNTTMEGNYRNAITIDVNSMKAIVSLDADEGDAIDSNGTLIINGGTIIALAKPGSDAGLDSSNGTYINGGTIISTGDMYDQISSDSKQNFMVLSFSERVNSDELITLLDNSDSLVFSFLTDRTYSNLIYSSPSLNGTYYLYKDGNVSSDDSLLYLSGTYTKGLILGYSNTLGIGGIPDNGMDRGERPELHNNMENGEMPEPPDGMDRGERPEFIINGISNIFGGISTYTE